MRIQSTLSARQRSHIADFQGTYLGVDWYFQPIQTEISYLVVVPYPYVAYVWNSIGCKCHTVCAILMTVYEIIKQLIFQILFHNKTPYAHSTPNSPTDYKFGYNDQNHWQVNKFGNSDQFPLYHSLRCERDPLYYQINWKKSSRLSGHNRHCQGRTICPSL